MNDTDALLLETWMRDRNAEAFKTLAKRYAGMVYGTCRRILNNPTEAEDAAQECFELLAATEKPVGDYLAPWLHRTACNKALTRLRSEQRRKEREARFVAETGVDAPLGWDDIYGLVDEAIAVLPDHLRTPVVAHFLDDQTHAAIALTLGVPRTTITDRIEKGVELLRETLKGRGVAITGAVLAGLIQANAAEAAPPALVARLGKIALSGAKSGGIAVVTTSAATTGFWTAKTMIGAGAVLAMVLAMIAGYSAVARAYSIGSAVAPLISLQQAAINSLPKGGPSGEGVPHPGVPGQANAAAPPMFPSPDELGAIAGRVYNKATGKGIPFSSVTAKGPSGEVKVHTDLQGGYEIKGLIPGQYALSAYAPFGHLNYGDSQNKNALVSPGARVGDLDFERDRGVSISGFVRDQTGRPVAGAEVSAPAMSGPTSRPGVSGNDGSFLLSGLLPNQSERNIMAQGGGMISSSEKMYSVGVENLEGVELVVYPGGRISGQLVDGAGIPVAGMRMHAWPKNMRGGGVLPSATTDKQGNFAFFPLEEGAHFLAVAPPGSNNRKNNTLDEVEVKFGEEIGGLVLAYDPNAGMRIAGRVTNAEGKPMAGRWVACAGAVSANQITGDDGRFELTRLPEGYYTLAVDQRVVKKDFLPDGADMNIVLAASKIQCRVVDGTGGAPVPRFQVRAVVQGRRLNAWQEQPMLHVYDPDGRYWMDLAPGDYDMCVSAPGYKAAAKRIHIPTASERPVTEEIALEPAAPLEVRTTGAQGNPVSGAGIYLFSREISSAVLYYGRARFPRNETPLGRTGVDGVFRTGQLAMDDGLVYVKHPSYAPASATMRLGEPIEVLLNQGGAVQCTVQVDGEAPPSYVQAGVSYPDQPELGVTWEKTGSDGVFRVEHVRPGKVLVRAKAVWQASGDREYSGEVTREIRVDDAGTAEVVLNLSREHCALAGGVLLENKPFGEFIIDVTVLTADNQKIRQTTRTGIDGGFLLENLPAGEALVSILPVYIGTTVFAAPVEPVAVTLLPDQENRVEFNFTAKDLE